MKISASKVLGTRENYLSGLLEDIVKGDIPTLFHSLVPRSIFLTLEETAPFIIYVIKIMFKTYFVSYRNAPTLTRTSVLPTDPITETLTDF